MMIIAIAISYSPSVVQANGVFSPKRTQAKKLGSFLLTPKSNFKLYPNG